MAGRTGRAAGAARNGSHWRGKHNYTIKTTRHPHRHRRNGLGWPASRKVTTAHSAGSTCYAGFAHSDSRQLLLQTAGPTFAEIRSHKRQRACRQRRNQRLDMRWSAMRYYRLPGHPPTSRKWGLWSLICPGLVSKVFFGQCHQLFDASYRGSDRRLARPLALGNTLRMEHQDGQTPGGEEHRPTCSRIVIGL